VSAPDAGLSLSISPSTVRAQVVRIANSASLAKSEQLIRFLQYVVEQTLAGRADHLKEYTIAIEVFRRPETHDPRVDPIVRTEARRLRGRLEQYYATQGLFDPIVIELPKGGYVPIFVASEFGRDRAAAALGQTFSHYRLTEILGQSSWQVVYQAEDTRLNRRVVLRLLSPAAVDRLRKDEFERAASLEHPNCSTVLEMDECDGHSFVVTSYVDGPTLQQLLEKGQLHIAQALRIADDLSLGLWAAHRRGIIHRNLKPSNVAISLDGQTKILDLGLGLLNEGSGSPYLAPEQTESNAGDQHSDIWSVGVILYQMLSGRLPFQDRSPAELPQSILTDSPPPLSVVEAEVPLMAIEPLIQKCLQKDPADRHQDISEFGTELRRIRTELGPTITQMHIRAVARKRKRTLLWLGLGLLALVVLAGLLAVALREGAVPIPSPSEPSIAVLPFDDLSPAGDSQAVAGAISESLMSTLSQLKGFRVISRTSAEAVKRKKMSVPEIAARLKVDYLLEGSLIRAGEHFHVTIQMIRTSDDNHIWSGEYDFPKTDVLKIVAQVSRRVMRQVKMKADPIAERTLKSRESSIDANAYTEYAQGRHEVILYQNTLRPEHAARAESHLRRATELAPQVVLYSVTLAELWQNFLYPPPPDREELLQKAEEALNRAIKGEPENAQAHYLMAFSEMLNGNPRKALDLTRSAVGLEPGNPHTYFYLASAYEALGFYESALHTIEQAISRDTLYLGSYVQKVRYLTKLNRISEAKKVLETVRELDSTGLASGFMMSEICHHEQDFSQCAEIWQSLERSSSAASYVTRSVIDVELALVNASKGDFIRARQYIKSLSDLRHRRHDHGILLAATLGEKELAFGLLRESPFFNNYRWLMDEPVFAKWRNDPAYRMLATELYEKWQRDFKELAPTLPVSLPNLPAPFEKRSDAL
jgi:eukaryotic-like serine/threonine-protein kinase